MNKTFKIVLKKLILLKCANLCDKLTKTDFSKGEGQYIVGFLIMHYPKLSINYTLHETVVEENRVKRNKIYYILFLYLQFCIYKNLINAYFEFCILPI